MAPDKPLPVESLLPFQQDRSPETLSFLQSSKRQNSNISNHSLDSAEEDEASANEGEKPKRQKRPRACVACRNMKIRCLEVEGQEACRACSKVNRECIMPGPPRKRQKTVHKVAELEKKINALTDALLAKAQQNDTPPDDSPEKDQATSASSAPSRLEDSSHTTLDQYEQSLGDKVYPPLPSTPPDFRKMCPHDANAVVKDNYVDVVERGILSMDTATHMFNYWLEHMCPNCPVVAFPRGTQAHEIRTRRPMTFLAILAVASAGCHASLQPILTTEVVRQLSERTLFHGDKSMDLAHAMLFQCQYYIRPRTARDLAFNQFIHSAIILCRDLGMGKRSRMQQSLGLAERTELSRTWLACYVASVSVATILRIPDVVRYDKYVEECLETLATSSYALPSDKWLRAIAKLNRIVQEVSETFNVDDPDIKLDFLSARTRHQLKYFEHQLQQWERSVDTEVDRRLVRFQYSCTNLYIHEIALHREHTRFEDVLPGKPDCDVYGSDTITARHIDALTTLLESCHAVLDTYLSLGVVFARSLPNLYIVWNAYAMVILIKLHWIINCPESKLGSTFSPDLKTEYYLDAILTLLNDMSVGGQSPCAEAFGFVFKKLKIWHLHRGGQFSDDEQGQDLDSRRRRATHIVQSDPLSIIASVKHASFTREVPSSASPSSYVPPTLSQQRIMIDNTLGSNLNAAYDAANYGNTNWEQFNFTAQEMDMFDVYMNNAGWMGYLL